MRRGDQNLRGAVVVQGFYEMGQQDQAPLGTEAGLAIPDDEGGVDLWATSQDVHADHEQICHSLGLRPEQVRCHPPGIGGAFGAREDMSLHIHLCMLALRTGRPVEARGLESGEAELPSEAEDGAELRGNAGSDAVISLRARREGSVDTDVEDAASGEADAGHPVPADLRPIPDLRPILAMLAALGFGYYFAFMRLVRGDLLNSYPFISSDGIEWLVGGFAVSRWFDEIAVPELPLLRNPGFIGVTSFDYLIGANGYFLFAVISFAVVAGLAAILLLARWGRVPGYQAGVVVLVLVVSPVGFSRMWLLSDQVATALMVLAAVALYPYATRRDWRWLIVGTVAAALGGVTQLYGLIGFLVAGGWVLAVSLWRRTPDYLLAGALVLAPAVTAVLSSVWLAQVPHTEVLVHLRLVEFNFNMAGFYANAWSIAFIALVPVLGVLAAYRWRDWTATPASVRGSSRSVISRPNLG